MNQADVAADDQGNIPHAKPVCGAATRICIHCRRHRATHPHRDCREFAAKPCANDKLIGKTGRCKLHGGKSKGGAASARFKNGDWSRYMPTDLGERFQAAMADRTLMQLRQDAALVTAQLTTYLGNLKNTGRPLTKAQEDRVMGLVEQRRKLAESEAKRLKDLQQMVTAEQFRTAMTTVVALFREYVTDQKHLREIQTRLGRLLLPAREGDE